MEDVIVVYAIAPAIIAAGIAALGMLGNAVISNRTSKRNIRDTNRANMQLAEYQHSRNMELWEKQNAYNAPESQMLRYQNAGLNPNLIYSQGNPGNASTPPQYDAPTMDYRGEVPFQIPDMVNMYQDLSMKVSQRKAVDANTENIEQRTLNDKITNVILGKQAGIKGVELERLTGLLPYQLSISESQAKKSKADAARAVTDAEFAGSRHASRLSLEKEQRLKAIQDRIWKENENELYQKYGIRSSDHILVRWLAIMMQEGGLSPLQMGGNFIKQLLKP